MRVAREQEVAAEEGFRVDPAKTRVAGAGSGEPGMRACPGVVLVGAGR